MQRSTQQDWTDNYPEQPLRYLTVTTTAVTGPKWTLKVLWSSLILKRQVPLEVWRRPNAHSHKKRTQTLSKPPALPRGLSKTMTVVSCLEYKWPGLQHTVAWVASGYMVKKQQVQTQTEVHREMRKGNRIQNVVGTDKKWGAKATGGNSRTWPYLRWAALKHWRKHGTVQVSPQYHHKRNQGQGQLIPPCYTVIV